MVSTYGDIMYGINGSQEVDDFCDDGDDLSWNTAFIIENLTFNFLSLKNTNDFVVIRNCDVTAEIYGIKIED